MCGRFVAISDPDGLARFFVVDDRRATALPASWNVAPTEDVYAVVEHDRRRALVTFRWGLVPHWGKPAGAAKMINARAESAADKPAYRDALRRRRCIIPADGFYEWRTIDGARVPHLIRPRDGHPMAFAGLWAVWRDPGNPGAEPLRTCTILTTAANEAVRPLHDRMPVILPADAWDVWLDRGLDDTDRLRDLLIPAPAAHLQVQPVSPSINNVREKSSPLTPRRRTGSSERFTSEAAAGSPDPPSQRPTARAIRRG